MLSGSSNSALGLLVILGVVEQVVLQLKRRLWLRGGGTAAAAAAPVPLGSATIYSCYAGITIATCCSCRRAAAAVAIEYNRDI